MAIFDLFSKRQKRLRGEVPDVYQYENLPTSFRRQIVHIVRDTFGEDTRSPHQSSGTFKVIHDVLCREYGLFSLSENANSHSEAIFRFFLQCECEFALDIIEICFKAVNTTVREYEYIYCTKNRELDPDEAISDLNARFREHGIGYQFESNELIRVDSQILHSDVVKPILRLLRTEERFKGANEEFLNAHSHFRHGRYKECLVDSLKAFESVMKSICEKQGWEYNQKDTAKKLIEVCLQNELIPPYLQSQFSSVQNLLASGVPTVRNKLGGHGQGAKKITVTESIASYALYLAATNMLFLTGMERENFS